MAFTTKIASETEPGVQIVIYNTDRSVGRIGVPSGEDVMLVQALFRIRYWEALQVGDEILDPPPGQNDIIKVDGWYGPSTQAYIDHFQNMLKARGKNILADGTLDPYRERPRILSKISRTEYTLAHLTVQCKRMCDANGERFYVDLPIRQDVPIQLRNALKVVKSTAAKYQ